MLAALTPVIANLPDGYRIETGGNIEESAKANAALAPIFPIMILVTLLILVVQTRTTEASAASCREHGQPQTQVRRSGLRGRILRE